MRSSTRILINASATYGRSLLVLALGLFSSRWILLGLGKVDYGLFGVVGSITVFITFLNAVMAASASRHLSLAMGKSRADASGGKEELQAWFNVSLSVHSLIPAALVLIGYPIGVWAVRNWLVIPPERVASCVWVFRLSVLSAFISMSVVPFRAVYVARQRIAEQALYETFDTLIKFGFAWSLLRYAGDRLLYYSSYTVATGILISAIYVTRALISFPETRISFKLWWDRRKISELTGYATWNLFGHLGWLGSNQGVALIGNKFYGPLVNAALSIGSMVTGHVTALTNALTSALHPEIIATEGAGDRPRMMRLAFSSCRLATLLNLLFVIPLFFEMEYVLTAWLKSPPQGAVLFCRIALLSAIFQSISIGHAVAMAAEGRIRNYQLTACALMLLAIPLAITGGKLGMRPWVIPGASSAAVAICSLGRVWWARIRVGMSFWLWLREVVMPLALLCLVCSAALAAIKLHLAPTFGRLVLSSACSGVISLGCAYLFVLSAQERNQVTGLASRFLARAKPA